MLSFLLHRKTNAFTFNHNLNRRPKYLLMLLLPFFAILAQAPFVAVKGQVTLTRAECQIQYVLVPMRHPEVYCLPPSVLLGMSLLLN